MMRLSLFCLLLTTTLAAQDQGQPLPLASDVVARMMERDNQRQAALGGYTSSRRYVLDNLNHHKRAEMLVTVKCLDNGSKQFQTVSASGWSIARSHVFPKLLESESEASSPNARERSRITPENYSFQMVGRAYVNDRAAYVMDITPKTQNKYLVQGRIWIDTDDYAIARIEGSPARSLSFWTKSVRFVHTYRKNGSFWLPESDHSVTDARILGTTEMTIEYFDYTPSSVAVAALLRPSAGRVP
jgi:hypothetical protein